MKRTPLDVTPPAIVRQTDELAELARRINAGHDVEAAQDNEGFTTALEMGGILLQAKDQCTRNQIPWLQWLKQHVKYTPPKAQYRMRIAAHWDILAPICKNVLHMGVTDAINILKKLKPKTDTTSDDSLDEPDTDDVRQADYITLDQWAELDRDERQDLLATEGDRKFNDQKDNESIEWSLWSWNPVTGCQHNCPYCYARDIAERFYEQKFTPSLWPNRLKAPQNTPFPAEKAADWMGHKNVFVCSMADLFGRWVPREWIDTVLSEVRTAPQWNFLFLTKFPIRMAEFDFPDNAWVGTTVDCQARVANAERAFRKVKAGVKWLSCEPLIEPLRFQDLGAFNWLVLGGASKSTQTPEWHPPRAWVATLKDEAKRLGIPVYEKSNLLLRERGYPGCPVVEATEAPAVLQYLPKDAR